MACVKGVNRSASVAFAPDAPYMAAGTMAGAVDLSFSSSANLEIFKLDFQSDDRELPVVGESTSSERFNRVSWGQNPSPSEEFSLGLIAGGLVDGNIAIWNPLSLIRSEASENALVSQLSRHRGPVRGLEFNALSPNHLASGADEGDICIWDIANPAEPTHFPPLKGSGSATQGEISFLSWNSKVQHILASTSYNGTTVIWDLKKQKPVISFSDSNRRRCSVLQWHPDVATQLIVASDDDSSPSLRLWDMRNIMTPVREFVGHTKGVIAMSWCPSDSSYLLTCAKDNRTICWDIVSGEIVSELPAGTNWNFDVHWYPKIPGVISASSFDGKIGIYNIEGCSRFGIEEGDFGAAPLRAPKWYKRKAGASFGFGGKLVSFFSNDASAGASEVYVHDLVTEHSLVSRSSEFEAAIHNGERYSLRLLCDKKSEESESEDDRETWGFLKVMFEDDGTARTKLLTHLGFSLPIESKDKGQDDLSQDVSAIGLEEKVADKGGYVADKETTTFLSDNGEDFFNNLPSPKAETPVSNSGDNFTVGGSVPSVEEMTQEMHVPEESVDPSFDASFDDDVQRALVVGDYKGAVALCISANKMADALVIAHVGGASLWDSARDQYLKTSHSPYLKVVSAMVNNDLMSLVNSRPLKSWKETLALLCTFAQREEWTLLCDTLASRLMAVGNTLAATLCYICAGNIDKAVEIWSRSLTADHEGKSYVDLLQDLMEKTIVLALATGQKQFSASLCKLVEKYAEILASQGLLTTAMEYLKLMGTDELSPELMILRDCVSRSTEVVKEVPKSMAFENPQSQTGSLYGADQSSFRAVEASPNYYQEAPSPLQQSTPGIPYGENYQQSFDSSYGRGGYGAPAPYQPAPQPQMFFPSQAPQVPQMNFAAPPVTTQPTVKPFVPATPPALRNAGQYQQPTLGSQLYPGIGNPNYQAGPPGGGSLGPIPSQAGPVPGHNMPQVLAPTAVSRGFMPIMNSGVQNPGMGPTQPSSPTQPAQVQPAVTPAAPPPTAQTADTSNVPAQQRPVITTLMRLFNETSEALGGSRANPAKKREIEDNSRKIGALFAKLNSGDISKNAAEKLVQLCQALDNGDFSTALQIQVQLTTSDWDECNFWLATLKRMIKTRQNVR
ncbi:protein transport protein SEC31 homolog B-like isoform X2 [Camellia sinensis]|uniref:protein transport protein SEC31 homolog B-like isoform X1 n=1 Tax=Camellia sinensis TaxID=4442 RepID=UPI001036911F|nr:protein transport protein SEC31 homolog B-like isoform X1 [Camellia sinensis]XP_028089676.1 protein transport protein SEC31 homolog B-like isoform X2 [Camellia sinensis]